MNVVFGDIARDEVSKQHTILELDTFGQFDKVITAYGVITPTDVNVMVLPRLESMIKLHESLMTNYKNQNWEFCKQAITELKGTWPTLMDEFYVELISRINDFEENQPPAGWSGIIGI